MAEDISYRYDVFISYHPRDGDWVWEWLLPRLEQAGLRVCIDQNCFQPGAPVATEIERAVKESRRTLVVMTPAWVEGQWDQFEALLIHQKDPAARIRRLIPLLLKPCDPPDRIKLLQWVDLTDPDRQEEQLQRVVDDIKGVSALPELRRDAFPEPARQRWELRWYSVAGVAAVLTLVTLVTFIITQRQPRKLTSMPEKGFNVAVAPFAVLDANGKYMNRSNKGTEYAQEAAHFLQGEADALRDVTSQTVIIQGPDELIIPVLTEESAANFATQANAQVVLFGEIKKIGPDSWELTPKLYFREKAAATLVPELGGTYGFGAPFAFGENLAGTYIFDDTWRERMHALAPILIGLSCYLYGSASMYDRAAYFFEQAINTTWTKEEDGGQEILYFFLGNAYVAYATLIYDKNEEVYLQLLKKGEAAFRQAIRINPEYARSRNGLGNTLFLLATEPASKKQCDFDRLEAAYRSHQQATKAKIQPKTGHAIFDAELGMGRARSQQAIYCQRPDLLTAAADHLDEALRIYESAPAPEEQNSFNAMIAFGESGHLDLGEAWYLSQDPNAMPEQIRTKLENAREAFAKAKALDLMINKEESQKYIEGTVLELEKYTNCVLMNPSFPNSFQECNNP